MQKIKIIIEIPVVDFAKRKALPIDTIMSTHIHTPAADYLGKMVIALKHET